MILPKLSIKDSMFSHAYSTSNWFKPTYFEWDFKNINGNILFFTDNNLKDFSQYLNIKKYAWLIESPSVTPLAYKYIQNNSQNFDCIFTHSKKLLLLQNTHLLPIGGCHLDENEISFEHEKTKLISMMYSFKRFAPGHEIRFQIANSFSNKIDIMGSGKTGIHVKKIHSCKDYAFSIVIENCKEDYYFTEKIIDCFLTGTIPIYWGCPSIGNFFNKNGFIIFDTLEDIGKIVDNKDFLLDFYKKNMHTIIENYDLAMKYKIAEDYLWENFNSLLI